MLTDAGHGKPPLLHPDAAVALILSKVRRLGVETVALSQAHGRILAEDLCALIDDPPFTKAAMDGFAVAGRDLDPGPYLVVGRVAAGSELLPQVGPGQCARVMTGARMPPGTSRVHRFERTEPPDASTGQLVRLVGQESRSNIIARGANHEAGSPLLSRRRLSA